MKAQPMPVQSITTSRAMRRVGLNEVTGTIEMDSINPPLQIHDRSQLPHKQIGVAVISNELGEILIDKRKMSGAMGGLWEFPGGKIEAGETIVDCIVREIREELAIDISVHEHLITIEHTYPTIRVTLIAHHCKHISGIPQPIESDEIRWVKIADLHQYQFPDANGAIVRAIEMAYDATNATEQPLR
jgi:8-oxo-dGTP diphosphatase